MTDTPKDLLWAWRVVNPDFTSSRGFRWPFPGGWAEASAPDPANTGACPEREGDGICLARTWVGAASGGTPARTILICGYRPEDVLGAEPDKIRVRRAYVLEVLSAETLLRNATGADLSRASLYGADLYGATGNTFTSLPSGYTVRDGLVVRV